MNTDKNLSIPLQSKEITDGVMLTRWAWRQMEHREHLQPLGGEGVPCTSWLSTPLQPPGGVPTHPRYARCTVVEGRSRGCWLGVTAPPTRPLPCGHPAGHAGPCCSGGLWGSLPGAPQILLALRVSAPRLWAPRPMSVPELWCKALCLEPLGGVAHRCHQGSASGALSAARTELRDEQGEGWPGPPAHLRQQPACSWAEPSASHQALSPLVPCSSGAPGRAPLQCWLLGQ